MGAEHEAVVLRFLGMLHDPVHPDLAGALADFTDDAIYQSLVPARAPLHGKATIIAELETQFSRYSECVCEILAIASSERHVFTERRDHVSMTAWDKRIFSSVNAVFDLDERGKIVAWREYWDTGDIAAQLGLTADEMRQLHDIAEPGA